MSGQDWDVPWQLALTVPGGDHVGASARTVELDGRCVHLLPDRRGGWQALDGRCARCGEPTRLAGAGRAEALEAACTVCPWRGAPGSGAPAPLPCMVVDEEVYVLLSQPPEAR